MLVDFTLDDASLNAFTSRFGRNKKRHIKQALAEIKREWQAEFKRQDARMQKVWTPLKTWVDGKTATKNATGIDPRSYAARKRRAYYRGKGGKSDVRYLRILKRTGRMLDGYIQGIEINDIDYTVSIPFPEEAELRARSHQGRGVGLPRGVLSTRPYDLERFEFTASRALRRALTRD